MKYILKHSLSDLVEHYNKAITKSTENPLTSSLPSSLPPTSLPPTFLLPTSSPPTTSKKFNHRYTSTSLKR